MNFEIQSENLIKQSAKKSRLSQKTSPQKQLHEKRKIYEQIPRYVDSIGQGCNSVHPNGIQLVKEVCGGLISHFSFFQNIFRPPQQFDPVNQTGMNSKEKTHKQVLLDYAKQIQGLGDKPGNECYPGQRKPTIEIELENFSKQVIFTLNSVLQQSDTAKQAIPEIQNLMFPNAADPTASNLSQNSSQFHGNILPISPRSCNSAESEAYKRLDAFQKQIVVLQEQLKAKDETMNKARKDFARDLQNRDNAMLMVTNPLSKQHRDTVKLTMNIFNFNDLMDLPPGLAAFFNEKQQILREQAQLQID